MKHWDKKTLYEDHPIFGIGMSSWHTMEYWNHRENLDITYYKKWDMQDLYLLELIN